MLLYEDRSKNPFKIHWLDCNEAKPELLKEKSFATSLPYITDIIGVQNGVDELFIATSLKNGIHCYSTATKSLKWRVVGKLPGMCKEMWAEGVATDGHGHLFVSDGWNGNRCTQMFSVADGQYLGCLIKEGEQGLGYPNGICWHSASHSLIVAHRKSAAWFLRMIDVEY